MDELEEFFNEVDNLGRFDFDLPAQRQRKVYMRNIFNPFNFYTQSEFRDRYRFNKETVREVILPEVADALRRYDNRGLPITPERQLLIALRFYATGHFQIEGGDLMYVSQPTVSKIVANVSYLLARKWPKFIHFPRTLEGLARTKDKFEALGRRGDVQGLPDIIGAIDCTHVKIFRPRGIEHSEVYRNRHSTFSVNVQAVVGPDMQFHDIVARWPGSAHDSRIFRNSRVHLRLTNNQLNGTLVGDSGYACTRYLLTPVLNPRTRAEERYNSVHTKRTRNIVERVFGVWKRRFPCLRKGLAYKITTTSNIIVACAVLHNIGILVGDQDEDDGRPLPPGIPVENAMERNPEGLAFRAMLIRTRYG